jgi:hypothetical protein
VVVAGLGRFLLPRRWRRRLARRFGRVWPGGRPPGAPSRFRPSLTPAEYELFCAGELRRAGWRADAVGATGDQGADIVATRRRHVLVVQCKLYAQPVGNRAVQEVHAARSHRRATLAAVVTNAGYTRAARQLAQSTGVLLLHHDQLCRFKGDPPADDGAAAERLSARATPVRKRRTARDARPPAR